MTPQNCKIKIKGAPHGASGHLISRLCARIQQTTKEELVVDTLASWQRYTIYKDKLTIFRLTSERWPYRECVLKEAHHKEGLPTLSVVASAIVLTTMKRLGLFEVAKSILDAQSSAFPSLRS